MRPEEELVFLLKQKGLILSCAESFTGGTISQKIVSVSGASQVFYEGIVSYNPQAKIDRLGVLDITIKDNGVVSSQVATEMATGLLKGGKCDVAVSSTGYADKTDDGGQVGLCYLAVCTKDKTLVEKLNFTESRTCIMEKASCRAIAMAIELIKSL